MRPIAALGAALLVSACVVIPETNDSLESARASYRQAAASPEVQLRAPVELQQAERALAESERLWKEGADPAIVTHHAYLAGQRARIAMASADFRKAEAAVATSSERRERVLLEARARELEAQRRQAARAEPQPKRIDSFHRFTLGSDVLFDDGTAVLTARGHKALDRVADLTRKEPESGVTIDGFTNGVGPLSEQRARALKDALVSRGIEAQRIDAHAMQVVIEPPGRASSGGGATRPGR